MRKIFAIAAVLALLSLGVAAQAASINYTVGSWTQQFASDVTPPTNAPHVIDGLGYPGDTVTLESCTGTLNLTPGTYTQKIGTLNLKIDYTYGGTATDPDVWSELLFNFNTDRDIFFGSTKAGTLSQAGNLNCTWDYDKATLNNGTKFTYVIDGYQVDVTSLGMDKAGWNVGDVYTANVMAQFDVAAVPEPGTILAALSILGPAGLVFRRRKA